MNDWIACLLTRPFLSLFSNQCVYLSLFPSQALRAAGDLVAGHAGGQKRLSMAIVPLPPAPAPLPALLAALKTVLHAADAGEQGAAEHLLRSYCSGMFWITGGGRGKRPVLYFDCAVGHLCKRCMELLRPAYPNTANCLWASLHVKGLCQLSQILHNQASICVS